MSRVLDPITRALEMRARLVALLPIAEGAFRNFAYRIPVLPCRPTVAWHDKPCSSKDPGRVRSIRIPRHRTRMTLLLHSMFAEKRI